MIQQRYDNYNVHEYSGLISSRKTYLKDDRTDRIIKARLVVFLFSYPDILLIDDSLNKHLSHERELFDCLD